jgi:osmotically-inducible protein OsmY
MKNPMKSSDKELRDAVLEALDKDQHVDATHVGVVAADGAVTLSGFVRSPAEEQAAVRTAERVQGAGAVADELEVRLQASPARTDAELAAEIARVRHWYPLIPASVTVHVKDRHVTLHGEVESDAQRREAEHIFGELRGVRGVENRISVRAHPQPHHRDIEERIDNAIRGTADTDARSIRATVEGGTVRLQGKVHSLEERRLAEDAAESTPGVTVVVNDIAVEP